MSIWLALSVLIVVVGLVMVVRHRSQKFEDAIEDEVDRIFTSRYIQRRLSMMRKNPDLARRKAEENRILDMVRDMQEPHRVRWNKTY